MLYAYIHLLPYVYPIEMFFPGINVYPGTAIEPFVKPKVDTKTGEQYCVCVRVRACVRVCVCVCVCERERERELERERACVHVCTFTAVAYYIHVFIRITTKDKTWNYTEGTGDVCVAA